MESSPVKVSCIPKFISAFFIAAKVGRQPKGLSMDKWIEYVVLDMVEHVCNSGGKKIMSLRPSWALKESLNHAARPCLKKSTQNMLYMYNGILSSL
jgi:hypothetical protein